MGRKSIEFNKDLLIKIATEVDQSGEFTKQGDVLTEIAQRYANENDSAPVSIATVIKKLTGWGHVLQTKGKKGFTTENLPERTTKAVKTSRKEKFDKNPEIKESFKMMKKYFPKRYGNLVDKASKGSVMAAIHLKCLDCTCNQMVEIRECAIKDCPLWALRPYKKGDKTPVPPEEQAELDEINGPEETE
jgi:hypothetical protein